MQLPREPRLVTEVPVEFSKLDQRVKATSEDISRHGLYVRTTGYLPVGDVVDLTITLPDGPPERVIGRVAHVLPERVAKALGRQPGLGFEFVEELPASLASYLDALAAEAELHEVASSGGHVVACDARRPMLERLSSTLESAGFSVDATASTEHAIAMALEEPPDGVLTSLHVEDGDTWHLLRRVTGEPALLDRPVILLGDDASDLKRLRAYRAGVADFIHEPFTDEELLIRLRRWLEIGRQRRKRSVLRGTLEEIGVPTLLTLLEFERKSGIVLLSRGADALELVIAGGRIVSVECRGDDDEQSLLLATLDWKEGDFEFRSCEVVTQGDAGTPVSQLLLDAARVGDEQARSSDDLL